MKKNRELHLLIIWKNALNKKKEILNDLNKNFKILNKYSILWSDKNYSNNLTRFYGTNLPDGSEKELHCGRGEFLLIVFEDENPIYGLRDTSHGKISVNINVFDKKNEYRKLTGGGHKIHTTNDEDETNHDLTLLLGMNIDDFRKKVKPSLKEEKLEQDLVGANSWNSIDELFYVLNNCTKYVVLRDFENDMIELENTLSYDADILCENLFNTQYILNAQLEIICGKKQYSTVLNKKKCFFDIKYVNDNYYCTELEVDILNNRKLYNGYYIPNEEYYYMSLLIHSLIHKFNFESEYNKRLGFLFKKHDINKNKKHYINLASKWMKSKNYYITIPKDNYNNFNIDNILCFDTVLLKYVLDDYKNLKLKKIDEQLSKLNHDYNNVLNLYNAMINSKSWKLVVKIRKILRRK